MPYLFDAGTSSLAEPASRMLFITRHLYLSTLPLSRMRVVSRSAKSILFGSE